MQRGQYSETCKAHLRGSKSSLLEEELYPMHTNLEVRPLDIFLNRHPWDSCGGLFRLATVFQVKMSLLGEAL